MLKFSLAIFLANTNNQRLEAKRKNQARPTTVLNPPYNFHQQYSARDIEKNFGEHASTKIVVNKKNSNGTAPFDFDLQFGT